MGALCCSYLWTNNLAKLRQNIMENKLEDMNRQLNQNKSKNLINSEIDNMGNTPLMLSIENRNLDCFKHLITYPGLDTNKTNILTGYSPLHLLAISQPIPYRTSPIHRNASESSPALKNLGNHEITLPTDRKSSLIKSNMSTPSLYKDSSSHRYSVSQSTKQIDEQTLRQMIRLLKKNGANLNLSVKMNHFNPQDANSYDAKLSNMNLTKNSMFNQIKSMTPLFAAILVSQNKVFIEEILLQGCDLNYQDPETKLSALHLACGLGRSDLISILLDSYSDCLIHSKSSNGFTCLHYLALSERDDLTAVQLIISHLKHKFIDQNIKENNSNKDLDEHLSEFINAQNNDNQTALMLAAARNKQNMVKFLLDYNASIKEVDKNGLTVTEYTKQNSCFLLLNSYVHMNRKKESMRSSQISLAISNQHLSVASQTSKSSIKSKTSLNNNLKDQEADSESESQRLDSISDRVIIEMNDE